MISIRSLNKFFNKGRQNEIHVINDASLELPEKGMVAIFGKSGCGKTTLLNVIGGLDRFQSGSLTVDGKDIRRDTDVVRNRLIGYIFQNYNLNKGESCFDNVADALRLCGITDREELETRTMAALANVGMDRYRARTPDSLSGGQQQRIAIARAIVKNPHIILADEPTGNLDEANTILIMDLLKEISRDHLVLLVTHEANLVDYYCDTVIELQDGKVMGIRNNTGANGFSARDKNDIFLGELEHSTLSDGNAEIEYFGDRPETPIHLRIVNNGGKYYIQVQTPRVQVLDEGSEVRLREGVYVQSEQAKAQSAGIDMSKLPPVQGTRYGRLFSFGSSVKSGYLANFHKRKKGKKLLQTCMALFAAILVLMSAMFGTAFQKLITADESYSHNTFYVYTPDGKVSETLNSAVGQPDSGIDSVRLMNGYPSGDEKINFMTGFFESFVINPVSSDFSSNAVRLERSLAQDLPLVAGRNTGLEDQELLITTAMADTLLEKSTLGYIRSYENLIGLITSQITSNGKNLRIAGVVKSDESAVYVSERAMSQFVLNSLRTLRVTPAKNYGMELSEGEAYFMLTDQNSEKVPKLNSTVKIHGRDIRVAKILSVYTDYQEWCRSEEIQLPDMDTWIRSVLKEEHPELEEDSGEYLEKMNELYNTRYYEFYIEQYYAHLDAFVRDLALFSPGDVDLWLYTEKQISAVKYQYIGEGEQLYRAAQFYELNHRYPTVEELQSGSLDGLVPGLYEVLNDYRMAYEEEFYRSQSYSDVSYYGSAYLVSDEDYAAFSKQYGETDASASNIFYEFSKDVGYSSASPDVVSSSNLIYTVVHSSNPAKTKAFLQDRFGDLSTEKPGMRALVLPEHIYEDLMQDQRSDIFTNLIIMAVLLALMSVCMYFIMRSALMNRIKEVGVYRAIGVSRKNLVFRFFTESLVLTTLTVLIGFLISSVVMKLWLVISPLMSDLFFYPLWMAGGLLVILYAICLFCGTVPILSLLRKTPSEILAKYDI